MTTDLFCFQLSPRHIILLSYSWFVKLRFSYLGRTSTQRLTSHVAAEEHVSDVLIPYPLQQTKAWVRAAVMHHTDTDKVGYLLPQHPTISAEDQAQKASAGQLSLHYQQQTTHFILQKAMGHELFGSRVSQEYCKEDNSPRDLSLHCRKLWEGAPLVTTVSLRKRCTSPRIYAL